MSASIRCVRISKERLETYVFVGNLSRQALNMHLRFLPYSNVGKVPPIEDFEIFLLPFPLLASRLQTFEPVSEMSKGKEQ
jgi:hypothetical protein